MFQPRSYSRRHTLKLGLGTLIGTLMTSQLNFIRSSTAQAETRDFSVNGDSALKDRAIAKGLLYGAATDHIGLSQDATLADRLVQECNLIALDGPLKWGHSSHLLRPDPYAYDFSAADFCMAFAQQHHLAVQAHNLVFYLDVPDWFKATVTPATVDQVLADHAQMVMGRYAGQIHSWNVVNEAIEPAGGRADGLRQTIWLDLMGDDYIDRVFRIAHAADSQALLLYNDHSLEYDQPDPEAKRSHTLKLLERLKANNVPVHALGLQAHLDAAYFSDFNAQKYRQFLADVASLGLRILVTELDVVDRALPADVQMRDVTIASIYEDYLSAVLDEPAVVSVTTFGLTDRYTWLSEYGKREDGLPVRALPLDENFNRKLVWNAIARAFDNAPSRSSTD